MDWNDDVIPDACKPDPNYVLEFDGINDAITVPASASLDLTGGSYTWESWAYREATGASDVMLAIGNHVNPGNTGDLLHIKWGSNQVFSFDQFADSIGVFDSAAQEWHHWAGTFNASTLQATLYRDGLQVAQGTFANGLLTTGDLLIAKRIDTSPDSFSKEGSMKSAFGPWSARKSKYRAASSPACRATHRASSATGVVEG